MSSTIVHGGLTFETIQHHDRLGYWVKITPKLYGPKIAIGDESNPFESEEAAINWIQANKHAYADLEKQRHAAFQTPMK